MSEHFDSLIETLRSQIQALSEGCASQVKLNKVLRRELYEHSAWIARLLRELKLSHEDSLRARQDLQSAQRLLPDLRLQAYRAQKLEKAAVDAYRDFKNRQLTVEVHGRPTENELLVLGLQKDLDAAQQHIAKLTLQLDARPADLHEAAAVDFHREATDAFASSVSSTDTWGVWEQGRIELELQRILEREHATTVTLSDAYGLPMAVVGDPSVGDGLSAVAGAAATLSRTAHDLLPMREVLQFSMEDEQGVTVTYTSIDVEGVRLLLGIWRQRSENGRVAKHSESVLRAAKPSEHYDKEQVGL